MGIGRTDTASARLRLGPTIALVTGLLASLAAPALAQDATPTPQAQPTVAPYVPPPDLGNIGGTITIDGSSTVFPITDEVRLRFQELAGDVEVEAEFRGTGGGFGRFCDAEIDIVDASRPIEADEVAACAANNVRFYGFEVAYDGITVVVNPANDFVSCLTLAQLQQLWRPDDPAGTWQELDPAWPDREIELFGPGVASGTFDYFTAAIVGEEGVSRDDYYASEDDDELVTAVADEENALGYFGFAYYANNQDRLRPVAVDAGQGCVLPSPETIAAGSYVPLSRPLYVYVRVESLARSIVLEFLRFYLASAREVVPVVGYVPLPDADYAAQQAKLEGAAVGNVPPDGP